MWKVVAVRLRPFFMQGKSQYLLCVVRLKNAVMRIFLPAYRRKADCFCTLPDVEFTLCQESHFILLFSQRQYAIIVIFHISIQTISKYRILMHLKQAV